MSVIPISIPTYGVRGTNIEGSKKPTAHGDIVRLVVLPNCNAELRCAYWLGALNGQQRVGCGINVLRFMSEIDEPNAQVGLTQALTSGQGTPFSDMVNWFNAKLINAGKSHYRNEKYSIIERQYKIDSIPNLTHYFNILDYNLPLNSCTIVKLNRDPDPIKRPVRATPGHYVLVSKDATGKIWTYEPYLSKPGDCNRREYKGTVSPGFFKAYDSQGYITASLLLIYRTIVVIGGESAEIKTPDSSSFIPNDAPFLMPEDTIQNLITDINNSTECKMGSTKGKTKKKQRKLNKKKRKTRRTN